MPTSSIPPLSMSSQILLRLTGPVDHLRICWQVGETVLDSVRFRVDPECTRYNVLLALQEMVTNVLRHAYEGDEQRPIEVVFTASEESFDMELRDQGPAFDPLQHDVTELLGDESIPTTAGGFGIHIAKLVMDEVAYERRDGWNVLRMTKLVQTPAGTN